MTLPVTEAVTYKDLWSEVSEEFWRKKKMKPAIRITWKKLQRSMWRQGCDTADLHREIPEITLSDQAQVQEIVFPVNTTCELKKK